MIVEPTDDLIQTGRNEFWWATHRVDQDQDLGGLFVRIILQDFCFPTVRLKFFRGDPEALRTLQDDRQAFGDERQSFGIVELA